jgi:glycosyltransferase involved in cell wall biosynthesis
MNKANIALVYDRVNKWGGAERVLLALHEIFPDAPLYTSVYDSAKAPWAKVFPAVYTSFLQKLPLANKYHELLGTFMPLAFESFDLSDYDIVVSVTSEAAKGVVVGPRTLHICYCLTPTRYLWSHHDLYFKNPVLRAFSGPSVRYLRSWDKRASGRPDIIVAISSEVKNRVRKYYEKEAAIIFPPVEIKVSAIKKKDKGEYFLMVSRLDYGYKKVNLAIKAFNKLGKPLVIVGEGRERKRLRRMAKKNIKFAGKVSERRLANYYLGAKALIMPQEEDFGIVAVEAQSFGVPVIAYKKGGAVDTVIDKKTGLFFDEQTVKSLIDAVKRFEKTEFVVDNLLTNSKRFSKNTFISKFLELVKTGGNIEKGYHPPRIRNSWYP